MAGQSQLRLDQRWVSVDEIAAYLGVSRYTVYRWIEGRGLPAHRIGKFWKFKREDVDDWVRAGRASSVQPEQVKGGAE